MKTASNLYNVASLVKQAAESPCLCKQGDLMSGALGGAVGSSAYADMKQNNIAAISDFVKNHPNITSSIGAGVGALVGRTPVGRVTGAVLGSAIGPTYSALANRFASKTAAFHPINRIHQYLEKYRLGSDEYEDQLEAEAEQEPQKMGPAEAVLATAGAGASLPIMFKAVGENSKHPYLRGAAGILAALSTQVASQKAGQYIDNKMHNRKYIVPGQTALGNELTSIGATAGAVGGGSLGYIPRRNVTDAYLGGLAGAATLGTAAGKFGDWISNYNNR